MTDRTRPTLRLRMPVTPSALDGRRPAGPGVPQPAPAPTVRPSAYVAPRPPTGPIRLEPSSRAILEELAALGLADAPEPPPSQ
jgi:hypothetical protein